MNEYLISYYYDEGNGNWRQGSTSIRATNAFEAKQKVYRFGIYNVQSIKMVSNNYHYGERFNNKGERI